MALLYFIMAGPGMAEVSANAFVHIYKGNPQTSDQNPDSEFFEAPQHRGLQSLHWQVMQQN